MLSEQTCTELLNSSPHDPLSTAAQPSLGYAFYDMALLVLALLTDATNFIQNANAKTSEHNVSLLSLCVCPKREMKLAKLTNLVLNIYNTMHKTNFLNLQCVKHYMNLCHTLMNSF